MDLLEQSTLATITYYNILNKPLTAWEIFKYHIKHKTLAQEINFNQIIQILSNSNELSKHISSKNGFYFLKDREWLVEQRIEKQKESERKWRKTRRFVRFMRVIPFVKMVLVSGSLGQNNADYDSDIDLLIVAKAGRIWTCRAFVTAFFHILGQRRHGSLIKNRFCLNHYITDKSLNISAHSLYNAQTYAFSVPLWEAEDNLYLKFQEMNSWIKDYIHFYPFSENRYLKKIKPNYIFSLIRKTREYILSGELGNWVEEIFCQMQSKRIKSNPYTYQSGGRVVFNEKQLEFHNCSPEKEILERYNKEIGKLGWPEEENSGLTV